MTVSRRRKVRCYYAPHQFLGENEERRSGTNLITAEEPASHICPRVERALTPEAEVRLLTCYGLRRHNESFAERNMDFWTAGQYLDRKIMPKIQLGFSYHYERGLTEGRNQPQFKGDASYVNHHLSIDL